MTESKQITAGDELDAYLVLIRELDRLRTENAQLRQALEAIERNCPKDEPKRVQLTARRSGKTTEWILWTNGNIARAALAESGERESEEA